MPSSLLARQSDTEPGRLSSEPLAIHINTTHGMAQGMAVHRLEGYEVEQGLTFHFTVEEPGLLYLQADTVDADGLADGGVNPTVWFPGSLPQEWVLEQSAQMVLLALEERGQYEVDLLPLIPGMAMGAAKIHTAFVPYPGQSTKDGEDEEELEIEAHPLNDLPTNPAGTDDGEDEEELEIEAHPLNDLPGGFVGTKDGEDEEELEIEAHPFRAAPPGVHSALQNLCTGGELDDYGDAFLCATAAGFEIALAGRLENDWDDDRDVFRLEVSGSVAPQRVEWILTAEDSPKDFHSRLLVDVFDSLGHRPVVTYLPSENAPGSALHGIGALPPGVYFVVVRGSSGWEGSYELMFRGGDFSHSMPVASTVEASGLTGR